MILAKYVWLQIFLKNITTENIWKIIAPLKLLFFILLSDPGVPGVRSMGPDVSNSLTTRLCADLTDVTLADDDSNSIPIDDVNKAILGNVAMQVAPSGGQH